MPTPPQKLAVVLAFVAGALGLTAAAIRFFADGTVDGTPLFGGLFMLALGYGGYSKLRSPQPPEGRRER